MEIKSVFDSSFIPYGKVVEGYDFTQLLEKLEQISEQPEEGTIYVPGAAELEALPVAAELQNRFYGGMPAQIGYCNGSNKTLNCLEYHRDSEVNIPTEDIVLLLALVSELEDYTLSTDKVRAFHVPAGTAVQFYETTLHYAPCNGPGKSGFRVAVVLPRDTNTEKPEIEVKCKEDQLLWAKNKWLIAHPDSGEAAMGAFVGLIGENITLD